MKKYSICFLLLLCIGGGLAGYFFMGGHQSLSEDEKMYIEEAKPASSERGYESIDTVDFRNLSRKLRYPQKRFRIYRHLFSGLHGLSFLSKS